MSIFHTIFECGFTSPRSPGRMNRLTLAEISVFHTEQLKLIVLNYYKLTFDKGTN